MTRLLLLGLFVAVASAINTVEITVNQDAQCGTTTTLGIEDEIDLFCNGDAPGTSCQFIFKAEHDTEKQCKGICYMFDLYPYITDPKVSLTINAVRLSMTYDNNTVSFPKDPVCSNEDTLRITVAEEAGYVFDDKRPERSYKFRLSVYNRCGTNGQVKNMKFEDVVDKAAGYHPPEVKEEREKNQFIAGILLGFGLACIFLIVLAVAYCYTRNSPNRGPNRSVGMPKVGGFKKKMKPNATPASNNEPMGVKYQSQDPDKKPEAEPMLKSEVEDPEKPPLDTAVSVDEVAETTEPLTDEKLADNNKPDNNTDNCNSDSKPDNTPCPDNSTPSYTTSDVGGGSGGGSSGGDGGADSGGGGGGSDD